MFFITEKCRIHAACGVSQTPNYFILLKGELTLIEYSPFWNTLKNSTESTYTLITQYHVSSATIDKLRKNKPMNTTTLNDLCRIFDCQIQDICQYTPSNKDQHL